MKAATAIALSFVASLSSARAASPLPVNLDGQPWLDFHLRLGMPQLGDAVDETVLVYTPRIEALIPVGEAGAIELQWAAALLDGEGDSRFVIGNLFAGYALNPRPDLRFTPGLVLPLAQISNDDLGDALAQAVTYGIAAAAYAGHELWLYLPETFGIIAPLHSRLVLSDVVSLESDAAVALLFPNGGDDDLEVVIDTEIAALVSVVRIGLGAIVLLTEDDDNAIISASLGVRVPVGRGQLWADLLVTLDEPALFADGAIPSIGVGYATPL